MTKTKTPALPEGILQSDLEYPVSPKAIGFGARLDAWYKKHRVIGQLRFWYTERFGWCIATLHIRNASRRSGARFTDSRTYAVTLDGNIVTLGLGPHVLCQHTVYVTQARAAALQRFIDLQESGLADAGSIRDRISSRRAATTLNSARFDPIRAF